MVLFGAFLIWAVLNFKSARARDRAQIQGAHTHQEVNTDGNALALSEVENMKPNLFASLITLVGGMALWAVITFVLHAKFVGVAPLG